MLKFIQEKIEQARKFGFKKGYKKGYDKGYENGYKKGYAYKRKEGLNLKQK